MYLGDTIEAVAGEKAGIIKRQVPVIYDDTVPEASEVIRERAVQMASKAYPVGKGDFSILETKDQGLSIRAEGEAAQAFAAAGPLVLEIPFEAPYQAENAMLAVKTAVVLGQPGRKKRRICYLAPYRTRITGLWPGCSVRGFPGRGSVWYI